MSIKLLSEEQFKTFQSARARLRLQSSKLSSEKKEMKNSFRFGDLQLGGELQAGILRQKRSIRELHVALSIVRGRLLSEIENPREKGVSTLDRAGVVAELSLIVPREEALILARQSGLIKPTGESADSSLSEPGRSQ